MSCPELKNECPPPPPPLPANDFTYTDKLAQALGSKISCTVDKSVSSDAYSFTAMVSVIPVNYSEKRTRYNDITLGCQEIKVIAQQYMESQRNISCVLNQSCNKQTNQINAEQLMTLKCEGAIIGGELSQLMNVKLVAEFNLTEDEITLISNEVKNVSSKIIEMLKNTSNGLFKEGGEGQRQLAEIKATVDTIDYKSKIKQSISEFNNAIKTNQTINIDGGKKCIVGNLTQNMQIEMFSSSIINTSLKNTFGGIFQDINTQDVETIKEAKKEEDKDMKKYLIIGGVVFLVLIIIVVILFTI